MKIPSLSKPFVNCKSGSGKFRFLISGMRVLDGAARRRRAYGRGVRSRGRADEGLIQARDDPAVWQHDEPVAVTIGRASPHSAVKLLNGPMGESPRWSLLGRLCTSIRPACSHGAISRRSDLRNVRARDKAQSGNGLGPIIAEDENCSW